MVEACRTFENLITYQKKTKDEGATKLNRMKIIRQTEECYEYCMTKSMFFEFYIYMQTPELTSIMCSVDNAIFNTYLPNEIVLSRGRNDSIASFLYDLISWEFKDYYSQLSGN